jgi:hypothetical protein
MRRDIIAGDTHNKKIAALGGEIQQPLVARMDNVEIAGNENNSLRIVRLLHNLRDNSCQIRIF